MTAAAAARRPPRSIASAIGAICACESPAQLEQHVGRALDVLDLVGEVHAGDLARALAALGAVVVDRGDDRAADVDLAGVAPGLRRALRHVLAAVADERRAS